ncbi:DUF7269 family protein [Halococcoides cellulosivorans]|uniref:Uncharacterized protein n=1 Tax=Halococcoides cellulosivorans TaxID=1679096 RepID=A0A2R4X2I0_9EURY|nr:hypothetical protein [Halococcoides cellulosivorans]AWB28010.1 hypothetical protein HARCEL1_09960 [Halococcoides cellulosivorans]
MRLRTWSELVSGGLLLAAVAVLVVPLPSAAQTLGWAIARQEWLLTASAALVGLSAVAALAASGGPGVEMLLAGLSSHRLSHRSRRPDDGLDLAVAGGDIEASLDRLREGSSEGVPVRTDRHRVRRRLTELAVATIAARDECSRAAAGERVARGTWTDDPRAAAFLADDERPPLDVRIEDWLFGPPTERRARATVAEIAARRDIDTEVERP